MMRGIAIFSFFAFSTVLIIVLQPGPRPDYGYEQIETLSNAATRNEVDAFKESPATPVITAPDDIVADLKAARQPSAVAATPVGGSLDRLQAALNASMGTPAAQPEPAPKPVLQPVAQVPRPVAAPTVQGVAPELRDMSWQTLNALNGLGHKSSAPGQEGSLLNSIVRRSMGQVGDTPTARPVAAQIQSPSVAIPTTRATSGEQTYIVAPGDTLALIAIKLYGSALATDRLIASNPALRTNPNDLRIGQELRYASR